MFNVVDVRRMFEEKPESILWLPAITLGYTFHLTGRPGDFGLAVAGIVGGRFFFDFFQSPLVEEDDNGPRVGDNAVSGLIANNPRWKNGILGFVAVLYVISLIFSIYRLAQLFSHSDAVLVGLGGIYLGISLIAALNWTLSSAPEDTAEAN